MAGTKEAYMICLDVGPSMRRKAHEYGDQTYLDVAMECISWIFQRRIFSESKDEIGLVLFGTTATDNPLAENEQYENITLFRELQPVDWEIVKKLDNIPGDCVHADFVDALVVALDALHNGTQNKKFAQKTVLLFSILDSEFTDDNIDTIIQSMKDNAVEFIAMGVANDSGDDGDSGDNAAASSVAKSNCKKTGQQVAGEKVVRSIVDQLEGTCYSLNEALPVLSFFSRRQVKPTAWKCNFEIGSDIRIPICMYLKTKEYKLKQSWKWMGNQENNDVQRATTYHRKEENDDEEEESVAKKRTVNGGPRDDEEDDAKAAGDEIDKEELIKAYRYGKTLVPLDKLNLESVKYKSDGKCFQLLSFTQKINVKREYFMGDGVHVVFADANDPTACVAFSAFVRAMLEANKTDGVYGIVRYCNSARSSPRIGALIPEIDASGLASMVYVLLPYTEDCRMFTMNSINVDKFKPSDAQNNAVDLLIQSMNLNQAKVDEYGKRYEAFLPEETINPYFQYMFYCMKQRILYPNEPLHAPPESLLSAINPLTEQLNLAKPAFESIKKQFMLEKVAKTEKRTAAETFKANDGPPEKLAKSDNVENVSNEKSVKISTVRPVEDFIASVTSDKENFDLASEKLSEIIKQFVFDGVGSQLYGKALDCLEAFRDQSVKHSLSGRFNRFISTFKALLLDKSKEEFWKNICKGNLGLISSEESPSSQVTKSEAEEFLKEVEIKSESAAQSNVQEAEENLLDELE